MKTCLFKTYLFGDKKISRDIEIDRRASLYDLAEAIVGAYDFNFDHAFGFFDKISERYFEAEIKYELFTDLIEEGEDLEPTGAGSVKKTEIGEVWENPHDKMLFLFDYGDGWLFVVELAGFGLVKPQTKYPRVIKKIGLAPEQYPEIEE